MLSPHITSRKGFSILVALGSIGVLLIIVINLANIYLNELKLSRMQYNNIVAYAQAEGAFEYAMLKLVNHREGFQDSMKGVDPDAHMFIGSTPRTSGTKVQYQISSQSTDDSFSLSGSSHLIIPLFVGTGDLIRNSSSSRDPRVGSNIEKVGQLSLSTDTDASSISWSIVAMSGSENIGLAGTGNISPTSVGTIRLTGHDCYNASGEKGICGDGIHGIEYGGDTIEYFYDIESSVMSFLQNDSHRDPYLLIFNAGSTSLLRIQTDSPFALPITDIITEAQKGNSVQSIRFSEDKSRYYDAIRYGVYNK